LPGKASLADPLNA